MLLLFETVETVDTRREIESGWRSDCALWKAVDPSLVVDNEDVGRVEGGRDEVGRKPLGGGRRVEGPPFRLDVALERTEAIDGDCDFGLVLTTDGVLEPTEGERGFTFVMIVLAGDGVFGSPAMEDRTDEELGVNFESGRSPDITSDLLVGSVASTVAKAEVGKVAGVVVVAVEFDIVLFAADLYELAVECMLLRSS